MVFRRENQPPTPFTYYVSFLGRKKLDQGHGFVIVERPEPIKSGKDVINLSRDIKKSQKLSSCTILNWTLLEFDGRNP